MLNNRQADFSDDGKKYSLDHSTVPRIVNCNRRLYFMFSNEKHVNELNNSTMVTSHYVVASHNTPTTYYLQPTIHNQGSNHVLGKLLSSTACISIFSCQLHVE